MQKESGARNLDSFIHNLNFLQKSGILSLSHGSTRFPPLQGFSQI
jgi:hypothetical protein